ncbi:hypothetical protein F2P79_024293 [Pimephales promelas]|nr:hypothetical protein F2P79_024293 [Pimephales promelas]
MDNVPAKRLKRRLSAEEVKERKKLFDRARDRTRVNIGRAFTEWRELKENEECRTDADLAFLLMQFYKRWQATTSTPRKGQCRPPQPVVSSIGTESDHDLEMNPNAIGVETLVREGEIEVLESSMHSLDISKQDNQDSPDEEEENDFRNTYIVMDPFWDNPKNVCFEDGYSSDEDFVPSLHLRTIGAKTDKLPEISVDEAVLDFFVSDCPVDESESDSVPEQHRITTEEDLVGKCANITYNDNLLQLARHLKLPIKNCKHMDRLSGCPCPGVPPFQVTLKPRGTGAVLEWFCPFGHSQWKWNSQPTLKFGMQGGDFMLSANILLSGNNYRKVALLFKFMAMGMVTESTYYRIQDAYCIEPVQDFWDNINAKVMERMRQKDHIVVLGDGRMDSPGHCAQYCTYTTIEQESRDIIHIVSVDKRETSRNSVIMEKECFVRTMDALLPNVKIKEVVTDAHPQIMALLNPERGRYKEWGLQHSLDIWHAAKSLSKRLRKAGAVKGQNHIHIWTRDIVNHFWYCSKQASTEEEFKPLEEGSQDKPWMEQGSAAHWALAAIVFDKRWLNQAKKFINFRTTSDLESFQNHILLYASKRMSYTPFIYKTRTLLAAIDYNLHNQRMPARNKDGHKMYKRAYNKKSKNWSVYTVKEKKDYKYIPDLQKAILGRRLKSRTGLPRKTTIRADDPRRLGLLSSAEPPPPTSELVQKHVSRGDTAPTKPQED